MNAEAGLATEERPAAQQVQVDDNAEHSNESPSKSSDGSNEGSPITPQQDSKKDGDASSPGSNEASPPIIIGGVKPEKRKYRRQLGDDGKPKKNFYNPPGKVMRNLAQQSYYDNFYGNQGQFYTLK